MTQQPEALRLADDLVGWMSNGLTEKAAAELRRLHAEVQCEEQRFAQLSDDYASLAEQNTMLDKKLAEFEAVNAQLLEALELALRSHGVMLLSDPPQDAWKTYGVEAKARAAIDAAHGITGESK